MTLDQRGLLLAITSGDTSIRQLAAQFNCSHTTITAAKKALATADLSAHDIETMSADAIAALFPTRGRPKNPDYLQPDIKRLVRMRHNNKRFNLQRQWHIYKDAAEQLGKKAYSYEQFRRLFDGYVDENKLTATLIHTAADAMHVDWAGTKLHYGTPDSPQVASIFVASLPYSGMIYATATTDQRMNNWLAAHIRALEFFGGVPAKIICDNAPTATTANRHNRRYRDIHPTYDRFADFYGTAIVPARPYKPRDKAHVENAVKLVTDTIIDVLEGTILPTLDDVNTAIARLLKQLNTNPYRDGVTRESEYATFEKPHMRPLPDARWQTVTWKQAKVRNDYHIRCDGYTYSVPYRYVRKTVDVQLTDDQVIVFFGGNEIARHRRGTGRKSNFITAVEHMPRTHRDTSATWNRGFFIRKAQAFGPACKQAMTQLLDHAVIEEQAYAACNNILELGQKNPHRDLEAICQHLLDNGRTITLTAVTKAMRATTPPPPSTPITPPPNNQINPKSLRGPQAFRLPE